VQIKKKYFCKQKQKMEPYNYIIVDDEYQSHITLRHRFRSYKNYKCVAAFLNPEEALLFLKENDVDLVFLDIEMPEMNGFQFLEALQKNFFIVLFTAFGEKYSFEAHQYYDKDLVFFSNKAQFSYYLPKITTRFEKMFTEKRLINRVKQLSENEIKTFPKKFNNQTVLLENIIYIEVIDHNIVLKMNNKEEFVCRMTIRNILSFLPKQNFFQIMRNIVINIKYVTAFTNTTVIVDGQHFIISKKKRQEINQELEVQRQRSLGNY